MASKRYPSLLPISSTQLERDLEQTAFFSNDLGSFNFTDIHDPYKCPVAMLSWLAWERHVDVYDESWPIQKKRDVIAGAPEVHLRKGTRGSMKRAVRFAGFGEIQIIERGKSQYYNGEHKYDGSINYGDAFWHWAHYKVIMELQVTTAQAKNVRQILNETAPARCKLIEINYLASIIYDGEHVYDGAYSFGAD